MYAIEGYWDVVPEIKNVSFPIRGKMQVDLEDGRSIIVDIARFPSIKNSQWLTEKIGIVWIMASPLINVTK